MRTFFGIILGVLLTIGVAYIYDATHALAGSTGTAAVEKPLVNWDIVGTKWDHLSARVQTEWNRLRG